MAELGAMGVVGRGRGSSLRHGDVLLVDAEDGGETFSALTIHPGVPPGPLSPHPERVARAQGRVESSKLRWRRKEEMHRSGQAANPPQDNVSLCFLGWGLILVCWGVMENKEENVRDC